ncbi:MAG: glycosyltransferase, partial [Solirubrobacteraceae bacterium]
MSSRVFAIVTARDEADRIGATLEALARAFPGAPVFVGDDGSLDGTAEIAERTGAVVVRSEHALG